MRVTPGRGRVTGARAAAFAVIFVALAPGCRGRDAPARPDAGTRALRPPRPPPAEPPPVLAPVAGANVGAGRAAFRAHCASCHGEDGRGAGVAEGRAPTDLTTTSYLCRSTVGRGAAPSQDDVEGALARGTHRGRRELAGLDAVTRRSLTLYVTSLAPGFSRDPAPVLAVPPAPPDTTERRREGRVLFLALGCWKCHGATGAGDGPATASLAWNGEPLGRLTPLAARDRWRCGDEPARVYRTIALGMGDSPVLMPGYAEYLELLARPAGDDPAAWTRPLEGAVAPAELEAVRRFFASLPERKTVQALAAEERHARVAAFLWALVAYVRAPSP